VTEPHVDAHPHGIFAIDTGFQRPRFDASHLVVEEGRAAFVDVGTNASVPTLLAALGRLGLTPESVDWVILTHVHLDHAGGAGELMRHLPRARLAVHPRGARHMADPSKLAAGVTAVYGEEVYRRDYGELIPVPAPRVVEAGEGFVADLGGRPLRFLDTPGHARHHVCVWDEKARSFFTGDTFGLAYPEFTTERGPLLIPTTTPVQFEPGAFHASIDRMVGFGPEAMYLTHYSRIGDVPARAADLHAGIDAHVELAREADGRPDRGPWLREALAGYFERRAREHGVDLPAVRVRELLATDIELNAQGLEVWLDRDRR
jgi:glyoxylase-like metal-dependent hydrolase (beta-lactamase superfamily II)